MKKYISDWGKLFFICSTTSVKARSMNYEISSTYLNRIFIDGSYKFENGIEPPYLNRNWLMHGRINRSIKRCECIQILNALSVIEFMFGDR